VMQRERPRVKQGMPRAMGAAIVTACLAFGWVPKADWQFLSVETRTKASFLRKMLSFVQWPEEKGKAKDQTLKFCVMGDHLLGFALTQELEATTRGDRKVQVRWVQKEQELRSCQALYLGAVSRKQSNRALESVRGASVLTMSDESGFLDSGGIVQLSFVKDGIRFEVNLAAARNAGLRMDARLLALAKRVVLGGELPGG